MYVNHSGWNAEHGFFDYNIFVDEKKQDYEIHFADGSVAKQNSEFQELTADWNNDGDIYPRFGAWFEVEPGRNEFWTPEDMVMMLIDSIDGNRSRGNASVVSIPGIVLPKKEKRPSLEDKIRSGEKRAMHQEIERNRKMAALGIRHSNDPWVK